MTSEDVIHSFFIPAFRVKGRAAGPVHQLWFEATKPAPTTCSAPSTAAPALPDGRQGRRDGAGRVRGLAVRFAPGPRSPRAGEAVQDLAATPATRTAPGRGPRPHQPLRPHGPAGRRASRSSPTRLPPRVDLEPGREGGRRLQPLMPTFQGLVDEDRPAAAHRVHTCARPRWGPTAGAAAPGAPTRTRHEPQPRN
jgi:hypothetical protein